MKARKHIPNRIKENIFDINGKQISWKQRKLFLI
jgi:hypothetical protein